MKRILEPAYHMHPEQIKADMRIAGVTPAALADKLEVSRMTVSNVIHNRITSRRIAEAIAKVIGKPVGSIWPGCYDSKTQGLRRRATTTRGARA